MPTEINGHDIDLFKMFGEEYMAKHAPWIINVKPTPGSVVRYKNQFWIFEQTMFKTQCHLTPVHLGTILTNIITRVKRDKLRIGTVVYYHDAFWVVDPGSPLSGINITCLSIYSNVKLMVSSNPDNYGIPLSELKPYSDIREVRSRKPYKKKAQPKPSIENNEEEDQDENDDIDEDFPDRQHDAYLAVKEQENHSKK